MSLASLAARFGIEIATGGEGTWLGRGSSRVLFARPFSVETPSARHEAWCAMLGTRLGLDRRHVDYDFAEERPATGGARSARNVYEVPSMYGERFQQLLPRAAIEVAQRVSGEELVQVPWFDAPDHAVVLVRELARHFHVLADADLDHVGYDRENMIGYARLALFYEAYNYRPVRIERADWGTMKWFETRDGQAASRATLLPDFDYDAARAHGAFVIVDRDRFVVAHPSGDPAAAQRALTAVLEREIPNATLPFSRRLWLMTDDAVRVGPTIGGGRDFESSGLCDAIESIRSEE